MKPVSIKIEGTLGSFNTEKFAFREGLGFSLISKVSKFFIIDFENVLDRTVFSRLNRPIKADVTAVSAPERSRPEISSFPPCLAANLALALSEASFDRV